MQQHIRGTSPWEDVVGYSQAVWVGYRVSVVSTTATVGGQVAQLGGVAGQTHISLTDLSRREEVKRVHGEVLGASRPAASMVQIAALIEPPHLVEMETDAVIGAGP